MINPQISAIERNIRESKALIEFGKSLERLKNNKDFKAVVLEGYFKAEAVRLVHLKADPNMQSPDSQKSIVSQMDAIGSFKGYMDAALHQASLAAKRIGDDEEALEELQAEELTGEVA